MGSLVMGKELLTDRKYVIFKDWLCTRPKMELNEPNVYPTILEVFRKVFGVRSKIWALKVPFLALENGHFWQIFENSIF